MAADPAPAPPGRPAALPQRRVGDVSVGVVGLGAMTLAQDGGVDVARARATIHAALDAGVTLIDTADAYAPDEHSVGHNERQVADALASYGADVSHVLVATKGGHTRVAGGGWDVDGRPEHLRAACDASLTALGVDAIGLYQHHRPDPAVPYAETIGGLKELRDAGKIRLVGISNADPEQIRLAVDILGPGGLASVQNELSPQFRSSEKELALCTELGIAFLPWSPLGGYGRAGALGQRWPVFDEIAREHGVSPQQVCLAWLLAKSPVVVPIPGASRPRSIRDSAAAAHVEVTAEEVRRIDEATADRSDAR